MERSAAGGEGTGRDATSLEKRCQLGSGRIIACVPPDAVRAARHHHTCTVSFESETKLHSSIQALNGWLKRIDNQVKPRLLLGL